MKKLSARWAAGALVPVAVAVGCSSGGELQGAVTNALVEAGPPNDAGIPTPAAACPPDGGTTPTLPAAFFQRCSGCHSAYGVSGNPVVPNLFSYSASTRTTEAAFLSQVRAPTSGTIMPPFTTGQISDADVQAIYTYFKAGVPAGACSAPRGPQVGAIGACSGEAVSYTPLFAPPAPASNPVSYIDPVTKHLIFRGAGRVRFRHEMESTFAIYHDHYFEDRTFGYVLDDSIPAGGTTVKVTFLPDVNQYYSKQGVAQQGGADLNIRYWKVYGGVDGNVFAGNAGGASNNVLPASCSDPRSPQCNTQAWTFTITSNLREHRPIEMGDQLQVEFGIFMAEYGNGQGPPVDGTHIRNALNPNGTLKAGCTLDGPPYTNACYTQANYYSDSFRYVVGKGTLTPYNQDCTMTVPPSWQGTAKDFPHPYDCSPAGPIAQAVAAGLLPDRTGPDEPGWSGGTTTSSYIRWRHDLYYSQMAPNIVAENAADFVQGRHLSHTNFTTGQDVEVGNQVTPTETAVHAGLAGPLYNQVACESCHAHDSRGVPPAAGMPFNSISVKTAGIGKDAHGGPTPDPNYGKLLQSKALGGAVAEGAGTFAYAAVVGAFADGTSYTLTKPTTMFLGLRAGNPVAYSVRAARPLIGLGLLEAIPEANILAQADPTDCNGDGIRGVPNLVFDPEDGQMHIGRFGWKASKASVRHQTAEALLLDIGVTTSVFPKHDCAPGEAACMAADKPTPELSDGDLDRLVTYMRELAVPPRRDMASLQVVRGEALFAQLGCATCHSPNQGTGATAPFLELRDQVIHPYTDLLLHDMGPDLADGSQGEYDASPTMWRTPPLWGIGLCDEVAAGFTSDPTMNPAPNLGPCHYLHDGRAASLLEAVLWHGGEALAVKNKAVALSGADRNALVAFLESL
jgi:CxxC motif-containing protein (DUF1111 family)